MSSTIIILQHIPDPDTGEEWLLQYVDREGRHEQEFHTFEQVSRFVESKLLAE